METARTEMISTDEDQHFSGYLALPTAGHGAGLLLIQEIFGVNDDVKDIASRLTGLGYVVLAPEVFWRQRQGFSLDSSDPDAIEPAVVTVAVDWDPEIGLSDLETAFRHLKELPEVTGAVGVIGFCFGGTQVIRLAKEVSPACVISYYGSGLAERLDDLQQITCPTLLHFADADANIPIDEVAAITAAVADNHHVVVHVHPGGGHACDYHLAANPPPDLDAIAWAQTGAYLDTHLGGPAIGA